MYAGSLGGMTERNRFPRLRRPVRLRRWALPAVAVPALALATAAAAGLSSPGPAGHLRARSAALARPLRSHAGQPGKKTTAPARPVAAGTSCRSVAHIGDSTSVGMVSAASLPARAQRLPAQYARVGVRHLLADASGGRSVVEVLPGQVNGYLTAQGMASRGFHGCWVLALGTNDTANVSAGSAAGRLARIRQMMSAAGGQPVLWVNTRTLDTSGPWAEANMRLWNSALQQSCARYPNLRVFDWASAAQPGWFIPDGIHYTQAGYAARAHAIADALARAYPAGGHSSGCLVR